MDSFLLLPGSLNVGITGVVAGVIGWPRDLVSSNCGHPGKASGSEIEEEKYGPAALGSSNIISIS